MSSTTNKMKPIKNEHCSPLPRWSLPARRRGRSSSVAGEGWKDWKVVIQKIRKSVKNINNSNLTLFRFVLNRDSAMARGQGRFLRRPLIAGQGGAVVDRQRAHPPGPWHDPKIACGHQKWKPEAKKIIPSTRPRDRMRPRTCGTRFDGRRVCGLVTGGGRGAFPPEPWWFVAHDRP